MPGGKSDLLVTAKVHTLPSSQILEDAMDAWNAMARWQKLSLIQLRTDSRRRALRQRLADCGGLPGGLRCSTSGIDGVLRPAGQRLTGTHSFLKSVIATYVPPKVAAPTLSDQARDAMLEGFRRDMAAIPASNLRLPPDGQVTAAPKPRPNHAAPAALLAFYEKQAEQPGRFQGAAQLRVDALRRQLAKGTPPPDA